MNRGADAEIAGEEDERTKCEPITRYVVGYIPKTKVNHFLKANVLIALTCNGC